VVKSCKNNDKDHKEANKYKNDHNIITMLCAGKIEEGELS
jgi:hypothetical protein